MIDSDSDIEHSIRAYLEGHGGSVKDAGGRGLTDELAKEIGVDNPMLVSTTLARMEGDGVVTREMRGLRTYRIALGTEDDPGKAPPAPTVPAAVNGGNTAAAAPVEQSPVANGEAVSLREALSRRSAAATAVAETGADESVVPDAVPEVVADAAPAESHADQPATDPSEETAKAMTLREALSHRATTAGPSPAASAVTAGSPTASTVAPVAAARTISPAGSLGVAGTKTESLPVIAPGSPPEQASDGPAEQAGGGAISLREALARSGNIVPQRSEPASRTGANPVSLRDATRAAPDEPEAPLARTSAKHGRRFKRTRGESEKHERAPLGSRVRALSMPVPEVKAPPSRTILIAVGAALAVLVLIAVISVVVTRPGHHVPALGTAQSSQDACQVVTADQATAAFGHNAGPPHLVLGTCVYDDGKNEFIVEIARHNARSLFDASHASSAQNIPGIGDAAYYADGRLWVLKQTSLMQLILGPVPAATPAPALLTLAHSAVGRL